MIRRALRLVLCVFLAAGCHEPGTAEEQSDPLDMPSDVSSDATDPVRDDIADQYEHQGDQPGDPEDAEEDSAEDFDVDGSNVDIPSTDTIPPEIAFASPEPWAVVTSHDLTVSGTAWDDVGMRKVELRVNNGPPLIPTGLESWTIDLTDLEDGEHMLLATAWDDAGNSTSTEIQVGINTCPPGIDLAITEAHLRQKTVKQYGGFYIDFEAENLGFDDIIWLLHTQVYLSQDDVLDPDTDIRVGVGDIFAEYWPRPFLNEVRGCTKTGNRELFVGLLQPILQGEYRVFLQLPFTSHYALPDVDMANNTVLLSETLTVLDEVAAPDLALEVRSVPDVFFTRSSAPIELRLTNQGDLRNSNASVQVWLDRIGDNNDVLDPEDHDLGSIQIRKGAPAPFVTRFPSIPDSRDGPRTPDLRGQWDLILHVDSGPNTPDSNPNNNGYKKRVKVERGNPSLRISLETTAPTANASEPLPIRLSVENQSAFPSAPLYSDLTLYTVGSDGEPDQPVIQLMEEDRFIGDGCDQVGFVPGLEPADSFTHESYKLTSYHPIDCELGMPYLPVLRYSVSDAMNPAVVASEPVELTSDIDLVVASTTFNESTISKGADEEADFFVEVVNQGTAANWGNICARMGFHVRVQLGTEPDPENDPRAGSGWVPLDSIYPGRSVKGRGRLYPGLAPIGTWPAYIVLERRVCEINYDNNISPLPMPITILP